MSPVEFSKCFCLSQSAMEKLHNIQETELNKAHLSNYHGLHSSSEKSHLLHDRGCSLWKRKPNKVLRNLQSTLDVYLVS